MPKFWTSMAFTAPEQYAPLARAVDEAGLHGIMVSDHIFWPQQLKSRYPYSPYEDGRPIWEPSTPWPDCWVMIGAMAAVTTRVQFATNIYIAPARDLFTVAKLVGTASRVASGRVSLGLGAGWMKEEFDQLGQKYENRGKRLDEMIEALRALWQPGWTEFHGRYYDFGPLQAPPVPDVLPAIWCGGHSEAALRRAAKLCDGWLGTGYTEDEAEHYLGLLQSYRREYGRAEEPFEIITGIQAPPTPELYEKWEKKGVTGFMTLPWYVDDAADHADVADRQQRTDLERKIEAVHRFAAQWR